MVIDVVFVSTDRGKIKVLFKGTNHTFDVPLIDILYKVIQFEIYGNCSSVKVNEPKIENI